VGKRERKRKGREIKGRQECRGGKEGGKRGARSRGEGSNSGGEGWVEEKGGRVEW